MLKCINVILSTLQQTAACRETPAGYENIAQHGMSQSNRVVSDTVYTAVRRWEKKKTC